MYQATKVKIDMEFAENYMAFHNLSKSEFSQKMGHSASWWTGVKRGGGYMPPNKAKLMCSMLDMDYEKLVIPERQTLPQNEQKSILEEDESLLKALVECMQRMETKANEAAMNMTRLEIQMRTVLKELGVK